MDVAEWLENHGLGQYAQLFDENDVDLEILPDLTEDDFENLGISLGHRKKLLRAIDALSAGPEPAGGETAAPDEMAAEQATTFPRREAERRQLTVMFCDLVGSTTLSGKVDPEDFRAIIQAYQEACSGVVTRFEGYVAKYLGDGMLAYFGYPQAHEDDAERAVRAGLGIIDAVAQLKPRPDLSLQVRVGIATGLVVVGDLVGEGVSEERAVSGATPNLAARLQAQATPNSVLISPATRNLVLGLFKFEDFGIQQLKGINEAVQLWQVTGELGMESRFEAVHAEGLTPLVARNEEIDLLMGRWKSAKQGEGQVVLLSGEPGIGKSRISQTLRERIADEPHTRLRYQCSPYHTNSALYPITTQLEFAARFAAGDSSEEKLKKLETVLAPSTKERHKVIPILAAALSIPAGGRHEPLNLPPPQLKERTFKVLFEQLEILAQEQPVLFLLEDAHWVDPTTSELLDIVVDRIQDAKVLVVITSRPEFTPPWAGYTHITSLTLNRLGRRHCEMLVSGVTGGKALPLEVLDQIVTKTDGMPLFVEELTKTVLESGILKPTSNAYVLTGPLPPLAIPTSLQDSLMARLDRLSPVKEVAQLGATIGREFSYKLLALVSPLRDNELQDALHQLVDSQLVSQRGTSPEATYTFKHALVQDTAYESLLKSTRQRFHQKIADSLEQHFEDVVALRHEILAHHCTEAQLTERAIHYWQLAGQSSSKRSATVEALAHLSKALELLGRLPESIERDRNELGLRIDLTTPLIAAKGMAAPEMRETITRARTLCERLGETTRLFPVLYGQWVFHHVSGQVTKGLEFAEEAYALAERETSEVPRMVAHRTLGIALIGLGEPAAALQHLEKGNQFYDAERHRDLALVYGMDFLEVNLAYIAVAHWFLGFSDQAIEANHQTIRFARSLSHANSLCHALCFGAGVLHSFNRQYHEAGKVGEELLQVSAEHNMPQWSLFGRMFKAFGLLQTDHDMEGLAMLRDCIERCKAVPMLANSTLAFANLAAHQAKKGAYQDALSTLAEADRVIEAGGERWAESELLRLKGEILRAQSAHKESEATLQEAITVAQRQPAKVLELRSATGLAHLWQEQGKIREARELLAPLYGWFTEGFDSVDLKEASALLDELT